MDFKVTKYLGEALNVMSLLASSVSHNTVSQLDGCVIMARPSIDRVEECFVYSISIKEVRKKLRAPCVSECELLSPHSLADMVC